MKNKVAFKAQYGSANYNLVLPTSDTDYATYHYPTFDDLYARADLSKPTKITEEEDNSWHDVRQLRSSLIKGSPNAIEILFSVNVEHNDDKMWEELHHIREDIARLNITGLFKASFGTFHNEVKRYTREIAKGDVVRAGKAAASGIRVMHTLFHYQSNNFTSYADALWYPAGIERDYLLKIKAGELPTEHINKIIADWYKLADEIRVPCEAKYKDEAWETEVNQIFYHYVKEQLKEEMLFGGR